MATQDRSSRPPRTPSSACSRCGRGPPTSWPSRCSGRLGQFWPRAVSGLYEEPKKLVAAGLARARPDDVGRRPRTRYEITAKGRRALAAWVPTPGDGPVVEFEQLVKIFFAEHGTKADLARHHRRRTRRARRNGSRRRRDVPHEYLEHRGGYPERLPWLILVGRFLDEIDQAVDRWTTWAADVVADWPDDITQAEPDWDALEEIASNADRLTTRAASATTTTGVTAPAATARDVSRSTR